MRKRPPSMLNCHFVLTLLLLVYAGLIGFGMVWIRHRIGVSANTSKALEQEIADVQRRVGEVVARVAVLRSTEQLILRNELLGLNLIQPREEQVIRAGEDVEFRLAAKRFDRLFSAHDQERRDLRGRWEGE